MSKRQSFLSWIYHKINDSRKSAGKFGTMIMWELMLAVMMVIDLMVIGNNSFIFVATYFMLSILYAIIKIIQYIRNKYLDETDPTYI